MRSLAAARSGQRTPGSGSRPRVTSSPPPSRPARAPANLWTVGRTASGRRKDESRRQKRTTPDGGHRGPSVRQTPGGGAGAPAHSTPRGNVHNQIMSHLSDQCNRPAGACKMMAPRERGAIRPRDLRVTKREFLVAVGQARHDRSISGLPARGCPFVSRSRRTHVRRRVFSTPIQQQRTVLTLSQIWETLRSRQPISNSGEAADEDRVRDTAAFVSPDHDGLSTMCDPYCHAPRRARAICRERTQVGRATTSAVTQFGDRDPGRIQPANLDDSPLHRPGNQPVTADEGSDCRDLRVHQRRHHHRGGILGAEQELHDA